MQKEIKAELEDLRDETEFIINYVVNEEKRKIYSSLVRIIGSDASE